MELIERIVFARENAELNQSELAKLMGITPQAIQNWEYGKSSPRLPRLKKLAEVLAVSEEWLTTGKGTFKRDKVTAEEDQKVTDDIMLILDQLEGDEKKDALELLQQMAKKRKILNKYGID